jgi:stage II sporulation protein D
VPRPDTPHAEPGPETRETELDFALAFTDTATLSSLLLQRPSDAPGQQGEKPRAGGHGNIRVSHTMVRVALKQGVGKSVFYSIGEVDIHAPRKKRPLACRGRIEVEPAGGAQGDITVDVRPYGNLRASLPCTLLARSSGNYIEFENASYRGSIIVVGSGAGRLTVVNLLGAEDYLRGVVPLEIGKRDMAEIEAVKAQAVAARTYTYRRIAEKEDMPFDLLPDVSDQVYGGVNAENRVCDMAIEQTRDMVLTYGGSICMAYYHSTCGGRTANIQDVWGKAPQPYLRSVADTDASGRAYCAISGSYSWEEQWGTRQLSDIITAYAPRAFPDSPRPQGTLTGLRIQHRFPCGRIASCLVVTSAGSYKYGGDRIRFVFRRNRPEFPILRSANFDIVSVGPDEVHIHGRGYGHGVGMCQMGAIGRACQGQSFEQILKAYYTGADISLVECDGCR